MDKGYAVFWICVEPVSKRWVLTTKLGDQVFSQHLIYYDLLCRRVHMNMMVNEIAISLKTNCVCLSTTLEGT